MNTPEKLSSLLERVIDDPTMGKLVRAALGGALILVGAMLWEARKELMAALLSAGPWTVIAALVAALLLVFALMSERLVRQAQERHKETQELLAATSHNLAESDDLIRRYARALRATLRRLRSAEASLKAAGLPAGEPLELDDDIADLLDTRGG